MVGEGCSFVVVGSGGGVEVVLGGSGVVVVGSEKVLDEEEELDEDEDEEDEDDEEEEDEEEDELEAEEEEEEEVIALEDSPSTAPPAMVGLLVDEAAAEDWAAVEDDSTPQAEAIHSSKDFPDFEITMPQGSEPMNIPVPAWPASVGFPEKPQPGLHSFKHSEFWYFLEQAGPPRALEKSDAKAQRKIAE